MYGGLTAEAMGGKTAAEAFATCDLDANGKLDLAEFKKW